MTFILGLLIFLLALLMGMLIIGGIFAVWVHLRPQDFDGSGADEDGNYPEWYGPGGY
jgi:uncharacterized membrane protein